MTWSECTRGVKFRFIYIPTRLCRGSRRQSLQMSEPQIIIIDDDDLPPASLSCPICQSKEMTRPVVLECGHMFCAACIIYAIVSDPRCPTCRANVPKRFQKIPTTKCQRCSERPQAIKTPCNCRLCDSCVEKGVKGVGYECAFCDKKTKTGFRRVFF